MLRSTNEVTIVGNLAADPEARYTPNGLAVTNIRIATHRYSTTKVDERGSAIKETSWHRAVLFAQPAEFLGANGHKGDQVMIRGRLRDRQYERDETYTIDKTSVKKLPDGTYSVTVPVTRTVIEIIAVEASLPQFTPVRQADDWGDVPSTQPAAVAGT